MTVIRHSSLASTPRMHACVFGASGYIGSNLVSELLKRGHRVRAVARRRTTLEDRGWHGAELCQADALKPETLDSALASSDVAYYLVHSMGAGRRFRQLDMAAADNFARAAKQFGVRRIVYLGGLVPPDAGSAHLLSRRDTGARLRAGGVPVTEIRAGIIVGPGSAAFEVIRDLVNHLPVMVAPRWVTAKSPPIALANLLEYLIAVPMLDETADRIFDAAGPEMLSYETLMRVYGELVGRRPIILRVPVLTPRLSSYWLRLITSVPTNIARALIDGLRHDIQANDAALRALVPQRLLTYREAVAAALASERGQSEPDFRATRWTEGGLLFRDYNPKYSYYAKKASGSAVTTASAAAVWRQIAAIGGDNRYYYLNGLWTVREALDAVVGGPGLQRGRRHPTDLRIGDMIDSWRVIGMQPGRRLTLAFGMKAPGAGVLELLVSPEPDGRNRVTATAYWHPAGVWGLMYWAALAPWHRLIFDGLTRAIAHRAEASEDGKNRRIDGGRADTLG